MATPHTSLPKMNKQFSTKAKQSFFFFFLSETIVEKQFLIKLQIVIFIHQKRKMKNVGAGWKQKKTEHVISLHVCSELCLGSRRETLRVAKLLWHLASVSAHVSVQEGKNNLRLFFLLSCMKWQLQGHNTHTKWPDIQLPAVCMHLAELVTVACTPLTCFLDAHLSSTHHTSQHLVIHAASALHAPLCPHTRAFALQPLALLWKNKKTKQKTEIFFF